MRVATRVANITPHCDVHLCGYVGEERKQFAKGVHDDPLAVSLLLEIEGTKLLFVSIDVVTLSKSRADLIKDKICDILKINKANIIMNAIHSHSLANGLCDEIAFGTPDNLPYFHEVCDKIVESLKGIETDLCETKLQIGTTKVHGFYSKRTNVTLPFEDNATIIKFTSKFDDKVIAAMVNFNCHATVLGPKNMMISADIIGEVRKLMSEQLQVVPYTFTGASGDISNRQFRQGNDFVELERVGKGISDILKAVDHYEEISLANFKVIPYDYHISYDNTQYFEEYQKGIAEANEVLAKQNISLDEWKMRTSEKVILESKMANTTIDFHVSGKIIKFDDLTIVTFPGELASKFGLQLREQCKTKHFLLIGYADDYQGYFIEAEEYGKTYETKASNTPKGDSEKIVRKIGELL